MTLPGIDGTVRHTSKDTCLLPALPIRDRRQCLALLGDWQTIEGEDHLGKAIVVGIQVGHGNAQILGELHGNAIVRLMLSRLVLVNAGAGRGRIDADPDAQLFLRDARCRSRLFEAAGQR